MNTIGNITTGVAKRVGGVVICRLVELSSKMEEGEEKRE
jgi:hypothetical protein